MRILCLDVGSHYIGLSISDPLQMLAQNLLTIKRKGIESDIGQIVDVISKYEVSTIVVGLPLHLNGDESQMSQLVRDFIKKLQKKIKYTTKLDRDVEFVFWDERFSTISAERVLIETGVRRENRKQIVDQLAASLILQSYLDSKRKDII